MRSNLLPAGTMPSYTYIYIYSLEPNIYIYIYIYLLITKASCIIHDMLVSLHTPQSLWGPTSSLRFHMEVSNYLTILQILPQEMWGSIG